MKFLFKRDKKQIIRFLKAFFLFHFIFKKETPFCLKNSNTIFNTAKRASKILNSKIVNNNPSDWAIEFNLQKIATWEDPPNPFLGAALAFFSFMFFFYSTGFPLIYIKAFFLAGTLLMLLIYSLIAFDAVLNFSDSNIYYSSDFENGNTIFILSSEESFDNNGEIRTIFEGKAKNFKENAVLIIDVNKYKTDGSCQFLELYEEFGRPLNFVIKID